MRTPGWGRWTTGPGHTDFRESTSVSAHSFIFPGWHVLGGHLHPFQNLSWDVISFIFSSINGELYLDQSMWVTSALSCELEAHTGLFRASTFSSDHEWASGAMRLSQIRQIQSPTGLWETNQYSLCTKQLLVVQKLYIFSKHFRFTLPHFFVVPSSGSYLLSSVTPTNAELLEKEAFQLEFSLPN